MRRRLARLLTDISALIILILAAIFAWLQNPSG